MEKTGIPTGNSEVLHMAFWKRSQQIDVSALEKRLSDLSLDLAVLRREFMNVREGLEDLKDKHISLRGKVYAAKLHKASEPEPAAAPQSREELRRSLAISGRFRPGQPPVHSE